MARAKSVNKQFFATWTSDMAYVLGFLFADGGVTTTERGAYYVAFHSEDKDLLVYVRAAMRSEHTIAKRSIRSGNVYRLQIGSKEMVADLAKLGLRENKTTRMKFPQIPSEFVPSFIRGFFDGDGNIWAGLLHPNRAKQSQGLQAAFTSASTEFLEDLRAALQKRGLLGGSLIRLRGKNCSRLSYGIKDSLKLGEIMYNESRVPFCLTRKRDVFKKYADTQS